MKIGVLGNADSWYISQLSAVGSRLGHAVFPLLFPDFQARTSDTRLTMACGDTDVTRLDAVIVRTMPPGSLERVVTRMDLLSGLEAAGVRVINTPRAIECAVDKWLTSQKLTQAGIPVPETAVCEDSDTAIELFGQLGGDVLVKPLFGSEGRGILRVDSVDLAWRIFRSLERIGSVIYLQRFIPDADGDYRVLLLDGNVIGSMKRTAPPDDFRTNAAQDGICRPWTPTDEEVRLAMTAANLTDCVFCGIDLIREDGVMKVLEVNAVPGWKALQKTCGICVPTLLFQWLAESFNTDFNTDRFSREAQWLH